MRSDVVSRRNALASVGALGLAFLSGCGSSGENSSGTLDFIHVSADGSDGNSGAEDAPLSSIQTAVERARPGQTVRVWPGEYREFIEFRTNGSPDAPITLTGPPEAVLKPPEDVDYGAVGVGASYIHITGLTISGLYSSDEPETAESYTPSHLVTLNTWAEDSGDFLEGLVISPHRIGNAGGALINSQMIRDSSIGGFEVIGPAGANWLFDSEKGGHYGEIVYLGTAPDNRLEYGYEEYDRTRNIRVHHIDNSAGHLHSELVDCKAGVENVTIEYCTDAGGLESEDSHYTRAISMDGRDCTIRWNVFRDIAAYGVQIGPQALLSGLNFIDKEPQTAYERTLGTGHAIYGNVFAGCRMDAVNLLRESARPGRETNPRSDDQRLLCNNLLDGYSDVTLDEDCTESHPTSEVVGHLGGESPWSAPPPTRQEVFDRYRSNTYLSLSVDQQSVPVNTSYEVDVTITNDSESSVEVDVSLRVEEFVLDEGSRTVPAGGERRFTLSESGRPKPGEVDVMLNGQKHGRVRVQ
jgi:hypothetical protein